jgi:hypothetical protein
MQQQEAYSLCQEHMNKLVRLHMHDGVVFDGIIEKVDDEHVYIAAPVADEEDMRAPYPGIGGGVGPVGDPGFGPGGRGFGGPGPWGPGPRPGPWGPGPWVGPGPWFGPGFWPYPRFRHYGLPLAGLAALSLFPFWI